jgi:lipopolysaccharide/colanic/teichoic acid biosynthesis glycosyltransferase
VSPAASSAIVRSRPRPGVSRGVERALTPRPLYETCAPVIHAALALVGLVLLAPLFIAIAVLIKATSQGPVLYRGERAGRHQRRFRICKFRTMVTGAEQQIGERLASDADKARLCTRVGRILKKTKLDELPQLLNVVRGDMRLVGPRPIRPVFIPRLTAQVPGYAARFVVPPGITGIAQLRGGYYTEPRDKLRYDLIYIARRSLALDLKVVTLTFVKILNRWLVTGLLVLFLFLFVSFVPAGLQAELGVSLFGVHVSAVALFIVAAAAWTVLRRRSQGFALYRCPLNVAVPLFVAVAVASCLVAAEPARVVQGAGYYLATGLLLAFLIVNSLAAQPFVTVTVRAVALTSAAVSLVGLVRLFLINHGAPADAVMPRLSSVVGNPVALSVYLVLGVPLLMAEVTLARGRRARDLWLVCLTISCVGVFLTQTRVGLLALLISAAVFLRGRRLSTLLVMSLLAGGVGLLALTVAPRMSPGKVAADIEHFIEEHRDVVRSLRGRHWLFGGRAPVAPGLGDAVDDGVPNMHLTLVLEHGLAGWLLFAWFVGTVLRRMKRAHDHVRDKRFRRRLWAIISSIIGFLVSMNAMNTFHHLPIQIFFWSLLGIGLAIVVREAGRPRNLIWRFGDAGD